jgi:hypothetical protein
MLWRAILAFVLTANVRAVTGNAANAVAAIEDALRSKEYQRALNLSRKALQFFPSDLRGSQRGTSRATSGEVSWQAAR